MTCKLGERHGQDVAGPVGRVTEARDLESLIRPLLEMLETVTGLESTYLTEIDLEQGTQHIRYALATWPGCRSRRGRRWSGAIPCAAGPSTRRGAIPDDVAAHWGAPGGAGPGHPHPSEQPGAHLVRFPLWHPVWPSAERKPLVEGGAADRLLRALIAEQVEREQLLQQLQRANENCHARPCPIPDRLAQSPGPDAGAHPAVLPCRIGPGTPSSSPLSISTASRPSAIPTATTRGSAAHHHGAAAEWDPAAATCWRASAATSLSPWA